MSRKKQLDKIEVLQRPKTKHRSLKFSFQMDETSWKEVLTTEDLGLSFGDKHIFAGVNVRVQKGDRIALVGSNGAGKTTFLKTINGMLPPSVGTFHWGNRIKVGYFSQQLEGVDESAPVSKRFWHCPALLGLTPIRS